VILVFLLNLLFNLIKLNFMRGPVVKIIRHVIFSYPCSKRFRKFQLFSDTYY